MKHPELEILLPSWIKERREKKGARVTIKEVQKKGMAILEDFGSDSDVKYESLWRMKDRAGLSLRRKNSEDQYKPNDLIPKCQRFVLHMKKLYEENTFSKVVAMDETPLFADNMGKTTLASKGAKEVKITTTGNEKKIQTLVLRINLDGSKN